MTSAVKAKRRYDSRRRREQAAQTRLDILTAAGRLFRAHGYAGTSMPAIAAEAGVVVETIYRAFGSKAGLFRAVVEALLAGGTARAGIPVAERPAIRAIIEEPDPRRQVALYAATQPGIHRRSGPILRSLAAAAHTDRELDALWRDMEAWRYQGQSRFVAMLAEQGKLRPGLSIGDASDRAWVLCSLAVHDLFVGDRRWGPKRYQAWLAEALARELLPH
jgi:AcrR family transcriptional regulator